MSSNVEDVATRMGVSKVTLYSYLNVIVRQKPAGSESWARST